MATPPRPVPGGLTFPPTPATPQRIIGGANITVARQASQAQPAAAAGAPPAAVRQQQAELRNQQQWAAILRMRQFRDLRFRINNFFEYNRRGLVDEHILLGELPWNDALVDPSKALAPYNPIGPVEDWNQIYNPFGNDDEAVRAQQAANMIPFGPPAPGFVRPKSDAGEAFVIGLRDRIRDRGLDIRTLRHLGAGGEGLATLFEVRSRRNGIRKKFVIKSSRRGEEGDLEYEKTYLMRLKRAPHITKGLLWADDILSGAPLTDNTRLFCQEMDARKDLLYLEFMKGGSLYNLIGKAVAAGAAFPNGVLWKVFFCLVRACLAMEYPPRLYLAENGEYDWYPETGEDGIEKVPDNYIYRVQGHGMVHFDLDPNNVLIGENDAKHSAVPIFKVGDFAASAVPRDINNRNAAWMVRRAGKRRHYMPEQFHKEWESVRILPKDEIPVPKVAGNFGPASNIWAIAMVMHDIITKNLPPDPPAAFGPMNGPDANLMPDGIQTFRDVNGDAVDPFYTHGSWLRDADINDDELKGLLIRCLADQPAHRPTLIELEAYLNKADRILAWDDDPDDREWFEQLINEAPDAAEMIDPLLDILVPDRASSVPAARDPGLPATNRLSNRQSSRLAFISSVLRTRPWPSRRSQATQAPRAPQQAQNAQAPQDGQKGPGRGFYRLVNVAGAGLQALTSVWSTAKAPQPVRATQEPPDTSAWLFNSNGDTLYLNARGLAVLGPVPGPGEDPAQAAGERGADPLPVTPTRPPRAGSSGAARPYGAADGAAYPSPMNTVLGSVPGPGSASPGAQSNSHLSERGRTWSTVSPEDEVLPDIFIVTRNPAAVDANGQPLGIPEGFAIPLTQGLRTRHLIPIPPFPPGMAPIPPRGGYQYGRALPSSPVIGQDVPVNTFTIRMDAADPDGGRPPNVFYRELNWAPVGGPLGDNAGGDPDFPQLGDREGQGPWLPRVRAVRIPPYGLFEKPPRRPKGYRYGRRLYLSPAELQGLADRGIRASPGRRIIRLVHVSAPRGASYERPTIFYQIQPRARAPKAPSDDSPDPTVLYCTLSDS